MKAVMQMNVDTTWGNRIHLSVETELDNPSVLTTQELSALMIHSLSLMLAEVRAEDFRHMSDEPATAQDALGERLHAAREGTSRSERERRERERLEEMRRDHGPEHEPEVPAEATA